MNILPKHFKRQRRAAATGKGCGTLRIAAAAFAERIRRRYRAGQLIPPHLLLFYLSWRRSVPRDRTRMVLVERKVREVQWRCVPALPRQEHGKNIRSLTGIPVDDRKGRLDSGGAYLYHATRSFLSVVFPHDLESGRRLSQHGRQALRQYSLLARFQHKQDLQPPNLAQALSSVASVSLMTPHRCRQALPGPAPRNSPAIQPLNIGGRAEADSLTASGSSFQPVRGHRSGEAGQLFPARLVQNLIRGRAAMLFWQPPLGGETTGDSLPPVENTFFLQKEVRSFRKMCETLFGKSSPGHMFSRPLSGPFTASHRDSFPQAQRTHGGRSPGVRAAIIRQGEHRHTQALQPSAHRNVRHALPPSVSAVKSSLPLQGTGAPLFPVFPQHSRVPAESALLWQAGGEHRPANAEPGGSAFKPTRRNASSWLGLRISGPDSPSVSAHSSSARYRQAVGQKGAPVDPGTTRTTTRQIMLRGGSVINKEPGKLLSTAGSLPLPLLARAPITLFRSTSPQLPGRKTIVSTRTIGPGAGTAQSHAISGLAVAPPASHGTAKTMPESNRNTGEAISLCYRQSAAMAATNNLPPGTHFAVDDHRHVTAESPQRSGQDGVEDPGGRKEAAALASAMEQHGKKTVQEYLQNLPPHEVSAVAEKVYGLIEKRLMVEHDRRGWL